MLFKEMCWLKRYVERERERERESKILQQKDKELIIFEW